MFAFFDDYNTPAIPSWLVANKHIYVIESPENTGMQDYKVFLNRIVSVSEADRTFTYRFDTGFPTFTASLDAIGETVFEELMGAIFLLLRLSKSLLGGCSLVKTKNHIVSFV